MKNLLLSLLLFANSLICFSLQDTLYINKDTITIYGASTSLCSFNYSSNFDVHNEHIQLLIQDSLEVTIFNSDSLEHTFTIDGVINTNNLISPNSSKTFKIKFSSTGTYRYYSDKTYGEIIGASGIINVVDRLDIHYYWNLFEVESGLSHDLSSDITSSYPISYEPNSFSINGYNYPATTMDTTGHVQQNVGDTINISIINSGSMEHVLHFHGYHIKILDAKVNTQQIGWIKDTFPLKLGEAMTIQLIPDQKGIYPVHEHNLIGVTNGGLYPGGMLTTLNIQ